MKEPALTRRETIADASLISRELTNARTSTTAFSHAGEEDTRERQVPGVGAVGAGIPFGMCKEIRPSSLVCPSALLSLFLLLLLPPWRVCRGPAIRRDRNSDDIPC